MGVGIIITVTVLRGVVIGLCPWISTCLVVSFSDGFLVIGILYS